MFMILQDESFSKGKKKGNKKNLDGGTRYILGTKFRSRTGCLVCRKKKRKCDEHHPICKFCEIRGLHCSYLDDEKSEGDDGGINPVNDTNSGNDSLKSGNSPISGNGDKRPEGFKSFDEPSDRSGTSKVQEFPTEKIPNNPSLSILGSVSNDEIIRKRQQLDDFQPIEEQVYEVYDDTYPPPDHEYHNSKTLEVSHPNNQLTINMVHPHDMNMHHNMNMNMENVNVMNMNNMNMMNMNHMNGMTMNNVNLMMNMNNINPMPNMHNMHNMNMQINQNLPNYDYMYNIPSEPTSLPLLYLDSKGMDFLDYFNHQVSKILAVGPEVSNHFQKTFYKLANNDESFMYAVISWSALYRGEQSDVNHYLNKAISKFNSQYDQNNAVKQDLSTIYFKLCFYTILYAQNICLGDTNKWYKILLECCLLFKANGGLKELSRKFNYSNEIRFIISNIQYSDTFGSKAHKFGPIFKSEEYADLVNNTPFKLNEMNYGIDTLQGILQSILTVFCETIELKVKIGKVHSKLLEIENQKEYFHFKDKNFQHINKEIENLQLKIEECVPHAQLLKLINDIEDYKLNNLCFKLYHRMTQLYFNLYIKQIPPNSLVNQILVNELYEIIDILVNTKFCVIVCFPLLLCGICCSNKFDKEKVEKKLLRAKNSTPVLNAEKIWVVIKRSWELNPHGNLIIDWSDICEEYGWCLNAC